LYTYCCKNPDISHNEKTLSEIARQLLKTLKVFHDQNIALKLLSPATIFISEDTEYEDTHVSIGDVLAMRILELKYQRMNSDKCLLSFFVSDSERLFLAP